jgi:hypothetical protein
MDENRTSMAQIKEQIAQGKYRVDAQAVADAIVRLLRELAAARAEKAGARARSAPA